MAEADYEVKKLQPNDRAQYSVFSIHRTCFLYGLYCCKPPLDYIHLTEIKQIDLFLLHIFPSLVVLLLVYSTGEFLFSASGSGTYCIETVNYECPPILGSVCRREVEFQRKAIMRNLVEQFNKKN